MGTPGHPNIVDRKRGPPPPPCRHAATSLPAAETPPPVPGEVTGMETSVLRYGISPCGTASSPVGTGKVMLEVRNTKKYRKK
jgi:hypothetical protein